MQENQGWVDLQVNGYRGVDFSSEELTLEQIGQVVQALKERGVDAFCPTVITSSEAIYRRNLPLLAKAMEDQDLAPHLLGVHLEGPFISPQDGARGAHSRTHVRPPDISFFDRMREWSDGRISLVTLAPELPEAMSLIRYIDRCGIPVSLGHHLADGDTIRRACDHGAVASTHLGNGIPNMLPRHPNPLWEQLAEERLTVMLIADGHHLPDSFLQVCFHAKSECRVVLVSDAAPIAGCPPGDYWNLGQKVRLEENGRLWNPEGNHLVGSSSSLRECVLRARGVLDLSDAQVQRMARENPLRLIKRENG